MNSIEAGQDGEREGPAYLYLTTTGRRSGQPREIEIWFTRAGGACYLVAETRERAHWVRNLQVNPQARWRVADHHFTGMGRLVDPRAEPELCARIRALSEARYGWGDGLVVELTPEGVPPHGDPRA